jgi:tetratricopeptide (TPR) repeat protein
MNFDNVFSANNKDEYAYQGLATLYVDWGERTPDPTEAADYLAKAEAVISDGLKHVRVRDGLWIVSSRIQRLLGDKPAYMEALIKAAREQSASIVAKYLLARAYRKDNKPDKAMEILKPIIEANTTEFRACVEYARAMEAMREPYAKCIAVLKLSTLYGLSDPRFISTLGGMLFMNGEFSPAQEVFRQTYRRQFPGPEASRMNFRPRNPANPSEPLRLLGRVGRIRVCPRTSHLNA